MSKPALPRHFDLWTEKMQVMWLKQNRPDLYEEYKKLFQDEVKQVLIKHLTIKNKS